VCSIYFVVVAIFQTLVEEINIICAPSILLFFAFFQTFVEDIKMTVLHLFCYYFFQTFVEDIKVYVGDVPKDEPDCGYDGSRCQPTKGGFKAMMRHL
jgi:hypothetical protein